MINIDIIESVDPKFDILITMESQYGFNREVLITDRITTATTKRRYNNKVANFEIEEAEHSPKHLPSTPSSNRSVKSDENKYAKVHPHLKFEACEDDSENFPYDWIALIGLSLAIFSTIQGICESASMYLSIDHSEFPEHRSIPAFGHLILSYVFLFNAALILALWCYNSIAYITIILGVNILTFILSVWLMASNYGMNTLQKIWKAFQEPSSVYDKIMVASWSQNEEGKFTFPDWKMLGIACAQNGSVNFVVILLFLSICTCIALLVDLKYDLKDTASSTSSISPIQQAPANPHRHTRKGFRNSWIFGVYGGCLAFCALFANFTLLLTNNLKVNPNQGAGVDGDNNHPYVTHAEGPRLAMFFSFAMTGFLSTLNWMTNSASKWTKMLLFICAIPALGCAIYSVFALNILYKERLHIRGGVYMDIHECSILPHQENQEFCVFNCTFSASDSTATNETISTTTQQTSMEVCTPLCIPLGKCALKLHVLYSWNVFSNGMCCLTPIHQITLASIYLW